MEKPFFQDRNLLGSMLNFGGEHHWRSRCGFRDHSLGMLLECVQSLRIAAPYAKVLGNHFDPENFLSVHQAAPRGVEHGWIVHCSVWLPEKLFALFTPVCHSRGNQHVFTEFWCGRCCAVLLLFVEFVERIVVQWIPHPFNGVVDTPLGTFLRDGMLRTS